MTDDQRAKWKTALAAHHRQQRSQRYRPRKGVLNARGAGMIRLPPATTQPQPEGEISMTETTTWRELFPQGRDIFYEGDNPAGFAAAVKAEFGFDPAADPRWGDGCQFHCPPEHLDAIYGGDRFPMGS